MRSKGAIVANTGDVIEAENARWSFAGDTGEKFDQHVKKSVPFYEQGHQLSLGLSDFFLSQGSVCYDLGCSTGTLLTNLALHHKNKGISFKGVDCEQDMLKIAKVNCHTHTEVTFESHRLENLSLEPSDLVIAYYTMQFVSPRHRQDVFNKIYQSLNWGGGFILFEKVRAPDARFQDIITTLYGDYKLDQGYTGDEIVSKTRSLKGVLEPFSHLGNMGLLKRAGFKDVTTIFKYLCFEGFLGVK